ncbi:MAG: glycosyltransferase [Flavobacteriales bacterium]|nr:glycosyltransferase [Flavobacteriales bacterium]
MKKIKALSTVYAHHETHGPGIYHNELLAKYCSEVDILYSNVMETTWKFPDNVRLITDRQEIIPWDTIYAKPVHIKWMYFLKYTRLMLKLIRKNKYDLVVLFNPPALLSYRIIKAFVPEKTKIWYHNYDPLNSETIKKYSQQWFALKAMNNVFPTIDLFTHSEEKRNRFFPIELLKKPYHILPNYPAIELHGGEERKLNANEPVKLIFSGVISEGNTLEELIKLTQKTIDGREIHLILKGFVKDHYKESLEALVKENNVQDKVTFIPAGPWREVPEILRTAHIGIHIFHKADIISKTMGKGGSGKVFQYIAEGLPVLMSNGFKTNFEEYDWAVATDIDQDSLLKNVTHLVTSYQSLTHKAIESFKTELSCNAAFEAIFQSLVE